MFAVTIRGMIVGGALKWVREVAGAPVVEQALETLPVIDRRPFSGFVLPFQKLPLDAWDRLLDECRVRTCQAIDLSEETFDRRLVAEAGSEVMNVFFHAFTRLFAMETVVKRVPLLHTRTYEPGFCEVVTNTPGACRVRFRTSSHVRAHFRRYQGPMLTQILTACGAKDVHSVIASENDDGARYTLEIETRWVR